MHAPIVSGPARQVELAQDMADVGDLHQAVVGGTGVYAGMTGSVKGTWLDARFARARVVFTLSA
jgi:hypothetical protein